MLNLESSDKSEYFCRNKFSVLRSSKCLLAINFLMFSALPLKNIYPAHFLTLFPNNAYKTIWFYFHPVCRLSRLCVPSMEHSDLLGRLISWVTIVAKTIKIESDEKKHSLEQLCGCCLLLSLHDWCQLAQKIFFLNEEKFPFLAPSTWLINFTFSFHGPFAIFKQHDKWIGVFCVSSIRNSIHLVLHESAND